jgi:hypothetical protein
MACSPLDRLRVLRPQSLGLLFYFAYSRNVAAVCFLVCGSAIFLELLQIVIPDRDARVIDALEKLADGAVDAPGACWLDANEHHLGLALAQDPSARPKGTFLSGRNCDLSIGTDTRNFTIDRRAHHWNVGFTCDVVHIRGARVSLTFQE